ncbi:Ribonucleoprotein [Platanthera zijinensis]|uniref:Ribonucleoprotein n=1 Tax=Platanthera zijinensis TaxID=2320716 RepID=A0AAP0BCC5_9ASPA
MTKVKLIRIEDFEVKRLRTKEFRMVKFCWDNCGKEELSWEREQAMLEESPNYFPQAGKSWVLFNCLKAFASMLCARARKHLDELCSLKNGLEKRRPYQMQELVGRIFRVQLAKNFSKPSSKKPRSNTRKGETRHKIYVGNLHWKARAVNLREFFSTKFNPSSARVVFDNSSGKPAGYGFVSFDTKEEMETIVSELEGEVMPNFNPN